MAIKLELPPDVEAHFLAEAKAKGVPVGDLIKTYLVPHALPREPTPVSAEELDKALEEIADSIPQNIPPLSDESLRRESIYTREDEW